MPTLPSDTPLPPIGVFDSGLGGLSILRAIRDQLPDHPLLYVADSGHAPYGDRDSDFVIDRTLRISRFLRARGAQSIVIACNTATTAAVSSLREQNPALAIVGVEPGIKPAAALTRNGRVGVMATSGTLRSEKFRLLAAAHAAHVQLFLQPCPGLVDAIEGGDLNAPAVLEMVARYVAPLREQQVDTVVLGCTHYPFIRAHLQQSLGPEVRLVDTAEAVARQTRLINSTRSTTPPAATTTATAPVGSTASVHLWTSGSVPRLQSVVKNWLGWDCMTLALPEQLS